MMATKYGERFRMNQTPTYKNPPVVEFVLGVQFSPLSKLRAGHFGLLWRELGADWGEPEDEPPIPTQLERFERPIWSQRGTPQFRISTAASLGRLVLNNRQKGQLIQVQSTRFHLNWRETRDLKPSYKKLVGEFEEMFERFRAFTVIHNLGELIPNQWELTYIDAYPQGEYWQTPADWSTFLPGLFGTLFSSNGLALEHRAAEWSYEIEPKRGRLHIAARPGRWRNGPVDSLLVDTTARGPIGKSGVSNLREGLDLGHDVAVRSFLEMTSPAVKQQWEELA